MGGGVYRALGPDAQAIRERNCRPSLRRAKQPQRAAESQALVALPPDGGPEVLAAHGEPGGPDRGGEGGGVEVVGDSAEGTGPSGGSGAVAAAGDNGTQGEEARASKKKPSPPSRRHSDHQTLC